MTSLPLPKRRKNQAGTQGVSHAHAPQQEKRLAKRLGASVVKASGALDEKGDVRKKGVVRIEAKCTIHNSFSVTEDMIRKIETAALSDGEMPVIVIDFLNDRGGVKHSVAVTPTYVLDMIMDGS